MPGLKPRLQRHAQARTAALKPSGVGQNAFDTGDVRERIPPTRDVVAVGIDADSGVTMETAPAQRFVEENASGSVDRSVDARGDHLDGDAGVTKRFDQGTSSDITAAALPDIPGNSCYEMKKTHVGRLEPAADDSVRCVLVPRAVPAERFYRSRRRHKQGRRQEPCYTPYHPRAALSNTFACLPAVLLRPAIRNVNSKTRFLGSLIATMTRHELFRI